MAKPKRTHKTFLNELLSKQHALNGQSKLFHQLRARGVREVNNTSFPGRKDEAWRFTNLRDLYNDSYLLASEINVQLPDISEYSIPESAQSRLVFVNGKFSAGHSSTKALPDEMIIGNLAKLAADDSKSAALIKDHLNEYGDFEEDIFSSFSNAFIEDGTFIYLPENLKVDTPVQLLHIQTDADEPYFSTSRTLVIADKNSELTMVEEFAGLGDNKYFNLPVVEIMLERDAFVKHTKIQRESDKAIHMARTGVHIKQYANYESYTITLGAKLSRNEPRITQLEEEVEFTVDGLVLIDDDQISDTHSVMDHRFSHVDSHQLHKCVINDKAHSIFNGKIFVRKDAQKIDSFQENRNLLLSRGGLVNTKPQLEIFADDVLCTHGATIGQLEEDEVFYLKSRGLSEQKARELLTYAFALETIENITIDSVQELLVDEVHKFTAKQLDSQLTA